MDNRRRQKIVDWAVQGRIIVLVLAGVLLTTVVFAGFTWYCVETIASISRSHPHVVAENINAQLRYFGIMTFLGVLTVIVFLLLLAIRMSHRMAGPIFRIKKDLDQMRNSGKINIIYIRTDDFHGDAVRAINQMLLYCRKKIKGEKPLEETEE